MSIWRKIRNEFVMDGETFIDAWEGDSQEGTVIAKVKGLEVTYLDERAIDDEDAQQKIKEVLKKNTWINTKTELKDIKSMITPNGKSLHLALVECHHETKTEEIQNIIQRELDNYFEVPFKLHSMELYEDRSRYYGWKLYRLVLI